MAVRILSQEKDQRDVALGHVLDMESSIRTTKQVAGILGSICESSSKLNCEDLEVIADILLQAANDLRESFSAAHASLSGKAAEEVTP